MLSLIPESPSEGDGKEQNLSQGLTLYGRIAKWLDTPLYLVTRNRLTLLGFLIATVLVVLAVGGPYMSSHDSNLPDPVSRLQSPNADHWMGTDNYGRDILARVLAATRIDLFIAITSVGISFLIGVVLGAICGYYRGFLNNLIMRVMDIQQSFPPFILAIGLSAALGGGMINIIYVVAIIQIPIYCRLVRGDILSAKEKPYVDAARCSGCKSWQIIVFHLFPNTLPPILVQVAINMSWAILNSAGLSFIGLGVRPPAAEWGIMIREGAEFTVTGEWWISFFPGLSIFLAILCFNLIADGLRDIFDPQLRR
jgi:peptide/nickel transport system permease protein